MRRCLRRSGALLVLSFAACLLVAPAGAACPDRGPLLLAPAPNSQQDPPVTFTWGAVPNAIEYRIILTKADGFLLSRSLTETILTLPLVPGQYKWHVDLISQGCEPVPSEERNLTVSGTLCPDQIPMPTAPAIGERVKSPVTLTWSGVPNAFRYAVQLFKDGAPVGEKLVDATSVTIDLPPGRYDWVVETRTATCPAMRSPFAFFVVPGTGQDCATEPPNLLAPAPFAEVTSPVQLSWTEVRGATEYRVTLIHAGVETVKTTTIPQISVALQAGGYDWRVEATAPGCPPVVSPTSFFRLTCHKGAPQLLSPPSGAEVKSPVEFKWSGSPEAKGYVLLIRLDGRMFAEIPTASTSQTLNLPPGDFEWSVAAGYEECPPEESTRNTFRIAGVTCVTTPPALTSPDDRAVLTTLPINFQWTAVEKAFAYQFLLGPADAPLSVVGQTKETSLKLPLPPDRYRWGVVALRDGCPPIESTTRLFDLQPSTSCKSDVPALVAPANGTALQPPVDFTWTSVEGAVEYVVFVVRPDGTATPVGSTQSGTTLRVEWLPAAKLQWFVAAVVPGCKPAESSRFSFEIAQIPGCPTFRPFTLLPPDGAENVPAHLRFEWTPLPGASAYQVWSSVDLGPFAKTGGEVSEPWVEADVSPGRITWFVAARVTGCPTIASEHAFFTAVAQSTACGLTARPALAGGAAVQSGEKYTLRWSPVPGAAEYELQEDTSERFTNPTSTRVKEVSAEVQKSATTPTPYAYRVRAIDSCQQPGPFSMPIVVVVVPKPPASAGEFSLLADIARRDNLTQEIFIPGSGPQLVTGSASPARRRAVGRHKPPSGGARFTASTDVPWMTLTPSSGELPPAGVTIKASIDPALLPAGTSRGVVKINTSGNAPLRSNGTTSGSNSVITVSMVTPVTPSTASSTARDGIIIPLVTDGGTTSSALAVSNLSSSPRKYELTFIPTDVDGTKEGKTTSIQVEPGETALLDQVLRSWFGAVPGTTTQGSIQVRPLDAETSTLSTARLTIASALLSSTLTSGALQTFIPQIPLSSFVQSGGTNTKLLLPDIRSSSSRSTSIGLLEGGGEAATAKVTVYDSSNTVVAQQNVDLRSREETLLDDLLANLTITGGRAVVELSSAAGRLAAFAHSTDTRSSDEQLDAPLALADVPAGHRIIPEAVQITDANSRTETTDVWLYNPSSSSLPVTLTFYPEGGSTEEASISFTLAAGETKLLEDVIGKSFQSDEERGSIDIDPGASGSVIVSARRVQAGPGGTYSTPLTPVSLSDGVAANERTLQILHGRASDQFQMDLTLVELAGQSATVEVSAIVPGTKVTPVTTLTLAANEMKRISPILGTLGLTDVYNARITVRVTSGSGRVWAQGTLIDLVTGDRSVIPAE